MTPQQIAHSIDVEAQRRFFRRRALTWRVLVWRIPQLCFAGALIWWVVR